MTMSDPIDPDRLLRAIARKESASGRNNCPRFEKAYAPQGETFTVQGREITGTGRYYAALADAWARWGMACAFSFSSWQIMYATAKKNGYLGPPWELWDDEVARPFVLKELGRLIKRYGDNIEEVASAWNAGTARFQDGRLRAPEYAAAVVGFYEATA